MTNNKGKYRRATLHQKLQENNHESFSGKTEDGKTRNKPRDIKMAIVRASFLSGNEMDRAKNGKLSVLSGQNSWRVLSAFTLTALALAVLLAEISTAGRDDICDLERGMSSKKPTKTIHETSAASC